MSAPRRLEISSKEMAAFLERLEKRELQDDDYELIKAMAETIKYLSLTLEQKNISIKRLRRMIFGAKTEKTLNVVGRQEADEKASEEETEHSHSPPGKEEDSSGQPAEKKSRKGHGRNGADAYRGSERVKVEHASLKPKDRCPACLRGKLYPLKEPAVVVCVVGRAPVHATVYKLERLRCNLCGKVFTAEYPEGCSDTKYDETVGSVIAVLKYGCGFPFYRLEKLQESFEIPLPTSTQWNIVEGKADRIYPVYRELIRQAAHGEVLYNDDTTVKIQLYCKTLYGAHIGDIFMSLIHTCNLSGVNAFKYLTVLEKHSREVFKNPNQWLPWNYQQQLPAETAKPA